MVVNNQQQVHCAVHDSGGEGIHGEVVGTRHTCQSAQ